MTQYALNDRGTVEIITDDVYDAEILRVFQGMRLDLQQIRDETAELVPEPDNPIHPQSVAVKVNGQKIGRMGPADSARYWNALSRVVASGYIPVAPVRLWAEDLRVRGQSRLKTRAVLSIANPDHLFPINATPTHAALLPQGPSVKVLDEKDHAEYLHEVLPESGDGRVILTLEANTVRLADGSLQDTVDVLHDRKVVGRLSTWMSEQLAPVIRYAFENNKLTAAWGTIRGNDFELSLTVQTVRAEDIPRSWYLDLPNDLPVLKEPAAEFDLDPAYEPSSGEADPSQRRPEEPLPPAASRSTGADEHSADLREPASSGRSAERRSTNPTAWGLWLALLGLIILLGGVLLVFLKPVLGMIGLLLGGAVTLLGLWFWRREIPAPRDEFDDPDQDRQDESFREDREPEDADLEDAAEDEDYGHDDVENGEQDALSSAEYGDLPEHDLENEHDAEVRPHHEDGVEEREQFDDEGSLSHGDSVHQEERESFEQPDTAESWNAEDSAAESPEHDVEDHESWDDESWEHEYEGVADPVDEHPEPVGATASTLASAKNAFRGRKRSRRRKR